jgi:hypothetical protein
MQASLAVLGGVFGLVSFFSALDWRWLLGAIVLLANWPYTMFMIMPTNRRLMDMSPEAPPPKHAACSSGGVLSMPGEVLSASRQP